MIYINNKRKRIIPECVGLVIAMIVAACAEQGILCILVKMPFNLAEHVEDYEGLILLGAYSTADLSETDLDVLSVYGTEDKVMNQKKYDTYKSNLPDDFSEVVLEGGCHAYFGMYGAQEGDGKPEISNEEQIFLTAKTIHKVMME